MGRSDRRVVLHCCGVLAAGGQTATWVSSANALEAETEEVARASLVVVLNSMMLAAPMVVVTTAVAVYAQV